MKRLTLLALSIFIVSCASNGPIFKQKIDKIEVTLPLYNFTLTVNDLRENISDDNIFLAPISFGGENDSITPPAPSELNSEFNKIINESQTDGKRTVTFQVDIEKGIQTFHFNGFHEVEYVEVILRIRAIDTNSGELIDERVSKSWGEKKTFDATYKRINWMYLTAFKQAFKSGLSEMII